MKPVIINLSTSHYFKGQQRLIQSVKKYSPNIPIISWSNESEIQAPLHRLNPYAFKVFGFYKAISLGYDTIFWMDASCYLIKPIEPLFDIIDNEGYFMHEAGHYANKWTNDHAQQYFNIPREKLETVTMFTAGCFGLSMLNQTASTFLDEWRKSMEAGCFKGDWCNHRHDLVCGSIVAHNLGMKYKFGEHYLCYASPEQQVNETVIIKLQGIH